MTFDVAARLAQGRPAVANTQTYVSACHAVGYQHPDLTTDGARIYEWYDDEDGLDLGALDADCAALQSAADAAEEALSIERDGLGALATAWQGGSADGAADFVERHCQAGAAVVAALRSAADGYAALRDNLWRIIEAKVDAAVTIDDRRAGQRAGWLAAAQTVMSGAADRTAAVDVVKQQIIPYVDGDIRADWVGAMRSATAWAATAYDDVIRRMNACAAPRFEGPAQLGPLPPQVAPPSQATSFTVIPPPAPAAAPAAPVPPPAPAAITAPAALPVEAPQPPPAPPMTPPEPITAPAPQGMDLPAGLGAGPASLPGAGATAPDLGGGLSGLIGRIADAFSGLLDGSPAAPESSPPDATGPPDPADPAADSEKDAPGAAPDDNAVDETKVDKPVQDSPTESPADEVVAEPSPPAEAPPPAEPVVAPAPVAPQPPPPEPTADAGTPCEIAADELAQVGQ